MKDETCDLRSEEEEWQGSGFVVDISSTNELSGRQYPGIVNCMDTALLHKEALQLPECERAVLADRLIESISRRTRDLESAWIREAEERTNAYHRGQIEAHDGPETLGELRSRFTE